MNEQQLLQTCLIELEKELKWGSCEDWTNQEFTELSNVILEKTGISLSVSSLRRLYGKSTDYKKKYNPQLDTKNALSIYLGYSDWHDYKKKKVSIKPYRKLIVYTSILLLLAGGVFLLPKPLNLDLFKLNRDVGSHNFYFEGKNLISDDVPHTVIINYKVDQLKQPLYVDWDDMPTDHSSEPEPVLITQDSGSLSHTYLSKDIYNIKLLDKNKNVLKLIQTFINTHGWECIAQQNNILIKIDSPNFHGTNDMCASSYYLSNKGINFTQPYRLYYRNIKDYGVSGNNFTFKAEFKTVIRQDYIECAHTQIELIGYNTGYLITFMNKGCAGAIQGLYLDKLKLNGSTNDLSAFTISDQDWHSFQLTVSNDTTKIFLNKNLIFKHYLQATESNLIGTRFEFLGNGCVRNVEFSEP